MHNSYDRLAQLLCEVPEYAVEGRLNKNIVAELARKYDAGLINKLLSDKDMKRLFFSESDAGLIFKKDIFLQFISQKEFLPDSYTAFEQKIGLASGGTMLRNDDRVVLNWPYKDCILEGGQTKEDAKRDEVFFNEILAPDEINTILEDKVFTNWKRYDKDGEHELDDLKPNDNLIIKGNNLVVLHSLKKRFAGRIKLIYIDPPYNTGNDEFKYNDNFNHSSWLTFMKNRLQVARQLLSDDGVIFIQCDDNEQPYLSILMDELYGRDNRINTIAVNMSTVSGTKIKHTIDGKRFPKTKEYILLYAKNKSAVKLSIPKQHKSKWDSEYNKIIPEWTNDDYELLAGGDLGKIEERLKELRLLSLTDYAKDNNIKLTDDWLWANAYRIFAVEQNESLRKTAREKSFEHPIGCVTSSQGLVKIISTAFNRDSTRARIELVSAQENGQVFLSDNWTDMPIGGGISYEGNVQLKNGKKPEKLIRRIIECASNEGDIVLDYHLGSGTTAAVAHKLGRQYIGIEQLWYGENDSINRLMGVVDGEQSGISKEVNWTGGGSFVYCNIKNDANKFREKVQAADDKKMDDLLDEVLHSSFLSYRVDAKNHNIKLGDFHKLSLADKKHVLLDLIDNNMLYLNYSEIDDATYKISDEDKKHNKAFYGE